MLTQEVKDRVVQEFRTHERDTGSVELRVALITERIRQVTDHLRVHRKDFASRVGLMKMVGERSRLLRYLAREDVDRYRALIAKLGLRK